MLKKAIVLACTILLLICISVPLFSSNRIKPITLTVIDSTTGLPVSDVTIYYTVTAFRPSLTWGSLTEYIYAIKLKTDSNGKVTIPGKRYSLKFLQRITGIDIYINLDTNSESWSKDSGYSLSRTLLHHELTRDALFVNDLYGATSVHIRKPGTGGEMEKKKEGDGEGEIIIVTKQFIWHYVYQPFAQRGLEITTKLERNVN